MTILIKILLLFCAIVSLVLILEQLYLIRLVVKNKGKVNDDGSSRLFLSAVLAVSVSLLIALWDIL